MIAMATGAGKTLTALICATRSQDRLERRSRFLIVVSAPSVPLIMQWREEVKKFGVTPCRPELGDEHRQGAHPPLPGTSKRRNPRRDCHQQPPLCTPKLSRRRSPAKVRGPRPAQSRNDADCGRSPYAWRRLVHPRTSQSSSRRRLALSATPERQYDPDGTEEIFEFFGPTAYAFGLDRAIGFCLVPYSYYVHASTLSGDELEEFERLTRRIGAAMGVGATARTTPACKRLLIARRRIIETGRE